MTNSNVGLMFSRFLVFSLLLSLLTYQTATAFTLPARGTAAAEIMVTGQSDAGEKPFVVVNGERAFNGRTFFSNQTISTTEKSSATINIGKLGRVELSPSSSLSLSFSEGSITGVLSQGQVNVSSVEGVAVRIETPDDAIKNDGSSASRFAVAVAGGHTGVNVAKGSVVNSSGKVTQDDDDDDDDDDHWKAWVWTGVIVAAVVTIVLIVTLGDDDDDTVSPVR